MKSALFVFTLVLSGTLGLGLAACGGTSTNDGVDTGTTASPDGGETQPGPDGAVAASDDAGTVGPGADASTSQDAGGTSTGDWTLVDTGGVRDLLQVAYSGSQYVITAGGAKVLTSPDRATWTERAPDSRVNRVGGITWSGTLFAVLGSWGGDYAQMSTSPDGIVWTKGATKMPRTSIAWSPTASTFVAVGTNGTVATSPDATTWTPQTSNLTENFNRVAWLGSQFVAVGTTCTIATSPDGVAWTKQAPNAGTGRNNELWGVASSGSTYVVVGASGIVLTSPDGVAWSDHTLADPASHQLKAVAWSGSQFVAVGRTGTFPNFTAAFYTSVDGASWTLTPLATTTGVTASFNDVFWDGSRFLAVGNAGLLYVK